MINFSSLFNFFKSTKRKNRQLILESIHEHRVLNQKAEQAIDKFIAAMDGEEQWFEGKKIHCECFGVDTNNKGGNKDATKSFTCSSHINNAA